MKKIIFATFGMMFLAVTMTSNAAFAPQRISVGAHGGITAGGDVDGGEPAFGGQGRVMFTEHFGIELALSHFSDEPARYVDVDVTTVGLSAVGSLELAPQLEGYVLGGVNYNFLSLSSRYPVSVDDDIGFHFGVGAGYEFAPNWEVFGEYRYTILSADVTHRDWWGATTSSEDIHFGLVKLGVNYRF